MTSAPAPRGRPPQGCIWMGGQYVDAETEEPHCPERCREQFLQRRRTYERARYWCPRTKVRKRRLERSARDGGRAPQPMQLRLDDVCPDA